jgi:Flp pilus assembly protein protease CpaA
MAGFELPPPSPWMLVALVPFGMFALKMIGGGAAKLLIALLPWFAPGEYLFVVAMGFFATGVAGLALKRKDLQIATPVLALGLVLQVASAALRHK